MIGGKDGIEVDGFSCQEGKPLLLGELWTFRRVGEAMSHGLEVKGIVLDEFKGVLKFGMEECMANLLNRLPWESGLVNPWSFCWSRSIIIVFPHRLILSPAQILLLHPLHGPLLHGSRQPEVDLVFPLLLHSQLLLALGSLLPDEGLIVHFHSCQASRHRSAGHC